MPLTTRPEEQEHQMTGRRFGDKLIRQAFDGVWPSGHYPLLVRLHEVE